MDMSAHSSLLTSGPAANRLRMARWRLLYLIERGDLPTPTFQVPGRRLFTEDDIRRIEEVLATRPDLRGGEATPPSTYPVA